jgi:chemotaxis protein histidine kinase CheA/CheY-specific phosphatase CheX
MSTEVTVETLTQIVESVFATMMDLEVSLSEARWLPDGDRLTSFVLLTGAWTGAVLIECNRWQACQFAGRILAMDPPETVDDDVLDVLGELANVVGGNLKCAMPAGVHLSMPSVTEGSDYGLHICGLKVQERAAFNSADGYFWVSVFSKDGEFSATWDGVERRRISDSPDPSEDQKLRNESAEQHAAAADTSVRVAIPLLERVTSLVDDFVHTQDEIRGCSSGRNDVVLNGISERLNVISVSLQDGMAQMSLQPVGAVWDRFARVVNERAILLSKSIQLVKTGGETELDRTILEAIKDPLLRLVCISCDHGIELPKVRTSAGKPAQGVLTLRACYEDGTVALEVEDDGVGISIACIKKSAVEKGLLRAEDAEELSDQDALKFMFGPGFNLAEPAANLSDCGIEMGMVQSQVERIGGSVEVFTRFGRGTRVKITVPRSNP